MNPPWTSIGIPPPSRLGCRAVDMGYRPRVPVRSNDLPPPAESRVDLTESRSPAFRGREARQPTTHPEPCRFEAASLPYSAFLIADHNPERTRVEACPAALSQEEAAGEVFVGDDRSMDGTVTGVDRLVGIGTCETLHRRTNGGPEPERKSGVRRSTAPYLCFLQADNLLPQGRALFHADYMGAHLDFQVAYPGSLVVRASNPDFNEPSPLKKGPDLLRTSIRGRRTDQFLLRVL